MNNETRTPKNAQGHAAPRSSMRSPQQVPAGQRNSSYNPQQKPCPDAMKAQSLSSAQNYQPRRKPINGQTTSSRPVTGQVAGRTSQNRQLPGQPRANQLPGQSRNQMKQLPTGHLGASQRAVQGQHPIPQGTPVPGAYRPATPATARAMSGSRKSPANRANRAMDAAGSAPQGFNPTPEPPHKKHATKIILIIMAILLTLLLVLAGGFYLYMQKITQDLNAEVQEELSASLIEPDRPDDPFYMLLIGNDHSKAREATMGENARSDSMILARVDPVKPQVTLVSIQRDTYVNLGPEYGSAKINAAYSYGGRALAVETISDFAGVPISHYAEIDFDGFKEAIDALGGIEVDVPIEIDDPRAGGHLDPGLQTLNGDQALILCRSRHAYDDVGPGDLYRTANQRMVIGAIIDKALKGGPDDIIAVLNALMKEKSVKTDLTPQEIAALALDMRGLDIEKDIYSAINPTISKFENNLWLEYADIDAWQTLMQRVDDGLPPYEDEKKNLNDGGGIDGTVWDGEAVFEETPVYEGSGEEVQQY